MPHAQIFRSIDRPVAVASLLGSVAVLSLAAPASGSVVLSNLSAFGGSEGLTFTSATAQAATRFTTGSGAWTLSAISMRGFASMSGTMEIWTDAPPGSGPLSSIPGTFVATSGVSVAGLSQAIDFDFTPGTTLAGGTSYWMVFNGPGSSIGLRQSSTAATPQGGSGWSGEATSLYRSGATPPAWADATPNAFSFFYAISVTPTAIPGGGVAAILLAASGIGGRRRRSSAVAREVRALADGAPSDRRP